MKVLLDEFIIHRAAGSIEEQRSVILLLSGIRTKCDKTVFTPNLLKNFRKKMKDYENRFRLQPKALKSFADFLKDSKKAVIIDRPPDADLPKELNHDKELVIAAIENESEKMLITTDEDLIASLQEQSFTTKYNIKALTPEKAAEERGYGCS